MPAGKPVGRALVRYLAGAAVIAASLVVSLAAAEILGRLIARPSEQSDMTLLGLPLPPERVALSGPPSDGGRAGRSVGVTVDGTELTNGDVIGHLRPDPVLGYTPVENARSANGWWRSNNIGARNMDDVERARPPGKTRVLVFGESFTHGSWVPQEDAWPNIMDASADDMQVVNLAVDGYSMAQALLRYEKVRGLIDYDVALLTFVPDADLWRDVNMLRELAEPWHTSLVMPRFILEDEELSLVRSPYTDPRTLYERNRDGLSPELEDLLRRYDRFYLPSRFESPDFLGHLVLRRMVARAEWAMDYRKIRGSLKDPDGEAMRVSQAIFRSMRRKAEADGAEFVLVVLPIEHKWRKGPDLREWRALVSFMCPPDSTCVDLVDLVIRIPDSEIDYAPDGAHFGPSMNRHISGEVLAAIRASTQLSGTAELTPEPSPGPWPGFFRLPTESDE